MKTAVAVLWLFLCLATVGLSGCASNQGALSATTGKADIVTESDEPESRKRARLRLELASGYFEQGQTNVALEDRKSTRLNSSHQ